MRLALVPTGAFTRDLKRLARRHVPLEPVEEVLESDSREFRSVAPDIEGASSDAYAARLCGCV